MCGGYDTDGGCGVYAEFVLAQKDPRLSVGALFVCGKLGATGSFYENPETQGVGVRPVLCGTGLNLFCVSEMTTTTRHGFPSYKTLLGRYVQKLRKTIRSNIQLVSVMDMYSCRPMGASVARLIILVSGARSRSWN